MTKEHPLLTDGKILLVIDPAQLNDDEIIRKAHIIAELNRNGYIDIKNRYGDKKTGTYIDLTTRIAEWIGADINDPSERGLKCTCPIACDCANHAQGLVSNECPIHNSEPQPSLDCPQHGHQLYLD